MATNDSAWAFQDTQWRWRRNREWIGARHSTPLFDVDNDGTVTVAPARGFAALTNSIGTIYQIPTGNAVGMVTGIDIVNTTLSHQHATIYIIEPGQSTANVARVIFHGWLSPGRLFRIDVPFHLAALSTIRGIMSSAASGVTVRVSALLFKTQPSHLSLQVIEGIALSGDPNHYVTPASGVGQSLLIGFAICNTGATHQYVTVNILPSAGSTGVDNSILRTMLKAESGVYVKCNEAMIASDTLRASTDGGSISFRPTILQAAI